MSESAKYEVAEYESIEQLNEAGEWRGTTLLPATLHLLTTREQDGKTIYIAVWRRRVLC